MTAATAQGADSVLPDDYLEWIRSLAAERRHGEGDRLGSANLIDDRSARRATEAIRRSTAVSLARPLTAGVSARGDDRPAFDLEVFYTDGPIGMGSDHVELDCHGLDNTHIDALNHLAVDGQWYGGWPVGDTDGPSLGDLWSRPLVTRGVHVDVPAIRGADWVDVDAPVTGADLDRALAAAGVSFEPGDALLLDMGRDRYEAAGATSPDGMRPGIGGDGARWIADHGVSVLCWDFLDAKHPDEPLAAVHMLHWAIGLLLVDNCDFRRVRPVVGTPATGSLVVAPLPIPGATGGNVNPIFIT